MSEFTDYYFDFDGITLHYVEAGSGPLVIFYHGFPLFWFSFHHQMTALKDHYRVVAVDGLGVNLSSKPTDLEKYKLENLAAQLDALANHLAPGEPFSLVGHDWGGALAWSFAQAYPDRLEKVIGINAPPTNQLLHLLQTNEEQRKRSSYMWLMRGGKTHTLITENGARRLWKNAYAKFRDLPHFTKAHDETFREALAIPGAVDGGINWYRANIPLLQDLEEAECWPSPTASTLYLRYLSGAKQTPPLWLSLLMNWISTPTTLRSNAFRTLVIRRCSKHRALQRPSSRNFSLARQPCDLAAKATNQSLASRQ